MTSFGATPKGNETEFRVWAPKAKRATLRLLRRDGAKQDFPMHAERNGVFTLAAQAGAGDRYFYLLDGDPLQLPDPASRLLPEGVHGPTEIVDPEAFRWSDESWRGLEYRDCIYYELHVGTFTPEGTFDGVIEKLDYLKQLGVTAIELMPVAAFPGKRNWGYDGVSMYAVQESYGGPEGLKRLVNAAHEKGLAVVLDVIYNHLGNEGNYLGKFGPYFTSKHKTPWGDAINYDDAGSEQVRRYIVENALFWVNEYHIDGLRLDAVHAMVDESETHVLAEIRDGVQQFASNTGRAITMVAESDENLRRYTLPREQGGYGLNGIWSDDFHHAVHTLFTGEHEGYYQDFGSAEQVAKALNEGFVFQGQEFKFWGKSRGESSAGLPFEAHVICVQNHDQVGNRAAGERLTELISKGKRKLLAAILLLAPQTPLIFMGQESDEPSPFQFFTDYGDPVLQKAVSEGRRNEFKEFSSFGSKVPDPQDPATFERSKLTWQLTRERKEMLDWYKQLIGLRKVLYADAARSCRAEMMGEQGIEVRIPAEEPLLVLQATWSGQQKMKLREDWEQMLSVNEDDCQLSIWVAPEFAQTAKQRCA
jgi:maltooligosyltrehalose trehalohydrolase